MTGLLVECVFLDLKRNKRHDLNFLSFFFGSQRLRNAWLIRWIWKGQKMKKSAWRTYIAFHCHPVKPCISQSLLIVRLMPNVIHIIFLLVVDLCYNCSIAMKWLFHRLVIYYTFIFEFNMSFSAINMKFLSIYC